MGRFLQVETSSQKEISSLRMNLEPGPSIEIDGGYVLRLPREEDAYQLSRVIDSNRAKLKEWLGWLDNSQTASDSLEFIQKTISDWMIRRLFSGLIYKENQIVGGMGFHTYKHNYMAMGYWIAGEYCGKGLATLATGKLIDWAFEHYPTLHLIEIAAAEKNVVSRRVIEKLGLKQEGMLRDREWLYDHYVNHIFYSVIREEWEKTHPIF